MQDTNKNGKEMHQWATELFPLCRSITGKGLRDTLLYIKNLLPNLKIHEIPTGTKVFDWTIPDEWSVNSAHLTHEDGTKILDFADSNLNIINYSTAIDKILDLRDLEKNLHSLPYQPDVTPYITSYYQRRWGFCLPHNQRKNLKKGKYHAYIDTSHKKGSLSLADIVIKGETKEEILFSTYVCHPSMANNELSGPVVATALARYVAQLPNRRYTYRFIFAPETIGAITYLSKNLDHLKKHTIAAFNLSCVGDDRTYSLMQSRFANTLADKAAHHILEHHCGKNNYDIYDYLMRGSDERQYSAPMVDLPMVGMMRSKYGTYPEYHTSADDLINVVTPKGLQGGYNINKKAIDLLEANHIYKTTKICEPQLGKYGLYPSLSVKKRPLDIKFMMNILAYADGNHDLISLANRINANAFDCIPIIKKLLDAKILKKIT